MGEREMQEQVAKCVARVVLKPREYLEKAERLAREFIKERDNNPNPAAWAAAEHALRTHLGEAGAVVGL